MARDTAAMLPRPRGTREHHFPFCPQCRSRAAHALDRRRVFGAARTLGRRAHQSRSAGFRHAWSSLSRAGGSCAAPPRHKLPAGIRCPSSEAARPMGLHHAHCVRFGAPHDLLSPHVSARSSRANRSRPHGRWWSGKSSRARVLGRRHGLREHWYWLTSVADVQCGRCFRDGRSRTIPGERMAPRWLARLFDRELPSIEEMTPPQAVDRIRRRRWTRSCQA